MRKQSIDSDLSSNDKKKSKRKISAWFAKVRELALYIGLIEKHLIAWYFLVADIS